MNRSLFTGLLSILFLFAAGFGSAQASHGGFVAAVEGTGSLEPLSAHFINSVIREAQDSGARLLVLFLNGNRGYSSSVESVVEGIRSSRIPVVVQTAPAPAPNSPAAYLRDASIPAPEPLGDSHRASGAGPTSVESLVYGLDGKQVTFHGRLIELRTKGLPIRSYRMRGAARLLSPLLDPNLAYVLLLVGIIGIAVELTLPGFGVPGILGGLSLLVSLIALGALSVNVGGLLIILLALALFIVDIKAPTHGVLSAGGIAALIAGSLLLFPSRAPLPGLPALRVSPLAVGLMTVLLSSALLGVVYLGAKSRRRKASVGSQTLIGLSGVALTEVSPEGIIRVWNEEWSAISVGDEIKPGDEVDVVDVRGVHLVIMRRI
ncbi:MAG TPA: NfeD family protein [Spirochaetia bacterium]|nr:NfeD family protein [Spirochaetia bacterium]